MFFICQKPHLNALHIIECLEIIVWGRLTELFILNRGVNCLFFVYKEYLSDTKIDGRLNVVWGLEFALPFMVLILCGTQYDVKYLNLLRIWFIVVIGFNPNEIWNIFVWFYWREMNFSNNCRKHWLQVLHWFLLT